MLQRILYIFCSENGDLQLSKDKLQSHEPTPEELIELDRVPERAGIVTRSGHICQICKFLPTTKNKYRELQVNNDPQYSEVIRGKMSYSVPGPFGEKTLQPTNQGGIALKKALHLPRAELQAGGKRLASFDEALHGETRSPGNVSEGNHQCGKDLGTQPEAPCKGKIEKRPNSMLNAI